MKRIASALAVGVLGATVLAGCSSEPTIIDLNEEVAASDTPAFVPESSPNPLEDYDSNVLEEQLAYVFPDVQIEDSETLSVEVQGFHVDYYTSYQLVDSFPSAVSGGPTLFAVVKTGSSIYEEDNSTISATADFVSMADYNKNVFGIGETGWENTMVSDLDADVKNVIALPYLGTSAVFWVDPEDALNRIAFSYEDNAYLLVFAGDPNTTLGIIDTLGFEE